LQFSKEIAVSSVYTFFMIKLKPALIISLLVAGCHNKPKTDQPVSDAPVTDTVVRIVSIPSPPEEKIEVVPFELIRQFPLINDTAVFIDQLRKACQLEAGENPVQQRLQKISYYKKIKLYGSDKTHVLLEYDYGDGAGASFPWKYQLLFTEDGKLIQQFSALRFRFLDVFPGQGPLLLTTISTSKGNGGHELYRFRGDTVENVYEGYYDYNLSTYDAHEDLSVFEPNELNVSLADDNNDGYKDMIFQGKLLLIQGRTDSGQWYNSIEKNGKRISYSINNPFKKIPLRLVFLYDPASGHFKEKEEYAKKYAEYH
jgi:hypothetical protein